MKKRLLICGALLLFACQGKAQKADNCKQVQIGNFELTAEISGTTYISRTAKHQVERNPQHGYEAKFEVVWVDEGTYELRNKELIKGPEQLKGPEGGVLRVEILEVKENTILVSTTSNFSDLKVEVEMEIVKEPWQ